MELRYSFFVYVAMLYMCLFVCNMCVQCLMEITSMHG